MVLKNIHSNKKCQAVIPNSKVPRNKALDELSSSEQLMNSMKTRKSDFITSPAINSSRHNEATELNSRYTKRDVVPHSDGLTI